MANCECHNQMVSYFLGIRFCWLNLLNLLNLHIKYINPWLISQLLTGVVGESCCSIRHLRKATACLFGWKLLMEWSMGQSFFLPIGMGTYGYVSLIYWYQFMVIVLISITYYFCIWHMWYISWWVFARWKKHLLRVKSLPWWLKHVKTIRSSLLGARGCGILQGSHCRLVPIKSDGQLVVSPRFTSWTCCETTSISIRFRMVLLLGSWFSMISGDCPANQGVPVATFAQCHHFRLNSQARRPSFSDQCRSSGDVNHP